ncbi:Txe/YoeB family addiction module toxin [Catenuloplanes japonicus]|uniref:Txe/YoeB family addiction module toxin n=1 Tax=Catenuloplanes japonicus TaxID=33876 RepID=UPI00052428C9|nr:Txe/YoeB family addiction module toxin [Catenuloplanes japonicus]
MKISFHEDAWEQYAEWLRRDRVVLGRINRLITDIARDPYDGLGKPEQLRGPLSGWWSRRITQEHRIVYRVVQDRIEIVRCRGHYQ